MVLTHQLKCSDQWDRVICNRTENILYIKHLVSLNYAFCCKVYSVCGAMLNNKNQSNV